MSYPLAIIVIRGKLMTQNTQSAHDNLTLHPPEFDLVVRDDPTGTLDESSGLCVCLNLASHQLVNHGHPLPADMVVELLFHPPGGAGRDVGRQAVDQLLRVVRLGFPELLPQQLACP